MASGGLRWAVNLKQWDPTAQEWCRAIACVQPEERDRINRFVYAEDAALSLVGRLLLRAASSKLLQVSGSSVAFGRSDRGKPFLLQPQEGRSLHFNVSHQGCYAVLATNWHSPVGVDVMQFTRPRGCSVTSFFQTMSRQFTTWEWEQIRSPSDDTLHLRNFYRFWCLKESYIKAEGTGLSHGLQRLEFTITSSPWGCGQLSSETSLRVDKEAVNGWVFEESLLDDEHCVAVATGNNSTPRATQLRLFEHVSVDNVLSALAPLQPIDAQDWHKHSTRPRKIHQQL